MSGTKTFVGFWPTAETNGAVDPFELEADGTPSLESVERLRDTVYHFSGSGWEMRVAGDYLCLLHLEKHETALVQQRKELEDEATTGHLTSLQPGFFRDQAAIWADYLSALNAWYLCLLAACHTGRNQYILHDFESLSFWDCEKVMYDAGQAVRHARYGRVHGRWLARFSERIYRQAPVQSPIDDGVFRDAASYWSALFAQSNIGIAEIGSKLLAEHRRRNHRLVVATAWFELESWIRTESRRVRFPQKISNQYGKKVKKTIETLIDDFPPGTAIGDTASELHVLRKKRNRIAHRNESADHAESAMAIECFLVMFNHRTGLFINLPTNPAPTIGLT